MAKNFRAPQVAMRADTHRVAACASGVLRHNCRFDSLAGGPEPRMGVMLEEATEVPLHIWTHSWSMALLIGRHMSPETRPDCMKQRGSDRAVDRSHPIFHMLDGKIRSCAARQRSIALPVAN